MLQTDCGYLCIYKKSSSIKIIQNARNAKKYIKYPNYDIFKNMNLHKNQQSSYETEK